MEDNEKKDVIQTTDFDAAGKKNALFEEKDIPAFSRGTRGRVSGPILEQFLSSGLPTARFKRELFPELKLGNLQILLKMYIQSHHLPIKIYKRMGELYFEKLEDPNTPVE
tara:strand:+ start:241 stop:570 length:330 start_codon:yes stop_codon:yes gene_type:complete